MSDDKQNQVREPQLLHSAAVSRRVDALFRAMSTDYLLREQFVTDPAQVLAEYVTGGGISAQKASVINHLVYSVMSNPGLVRWFGDYAAGRRGIPPTNRQFMIDFGRAVVENGGHHVVYALTRASIEQENVMGFDDSVLDVLFASGGIVTEGPGTFGGTEGTFGGTEGTFGGTEVTFGGTARTFGGTRGTFGDGTGMLTQDDGTGTEVSTGTGGTEMSTGTGGTEVSTGTGGTEASTGTGGTEASTGTGTVTGGPGTNGPPVTSINTGTATSTSPGTSTRPGTGTSPGTGTNVTLGGTFAGTDGTFGGTAGTSGGTAGTLGGHTLGTAGTLGGGTFGGGTFGGGTFGGSILRSAEARVTLEALAQFAVLLRDRGALDTVGGS
jgi:hypothetical protein